MKACQPCGLRFATWHMFVKHMASTHDLDRETLWRRANQIGDAQAVAVRSDKGRWLLMAQGSLL